MAARAPWGADRSVGREGGVGMEDREGATSALREMAVMVGRIINASTMPAVNSELP